MSKHKISYKMEYDCHSKRSICYMMCTEKMAGFLKVHYKINSGDDLRLGRFIWSWVSSW